MKSRVQHCDVTVHHIWVRLHKSKADGALHEAQICTRRKRKKNETMAKTDKRGARAGATTPRATATVVALPRTRFVSPKAEPLAVHRRVAPRVHGSPSGSQASSGDSLARSSFMRFLTGIIPMLSPVTDAPKIFSLPLLRAKAASGRASVSGHGGVVLRLDATPEKLDRVESAKKKRKIGPDLEHIV